MDFAGHIMVVFSINCVPIFHSSVIFISQQIQLCIKLTVK